MAGAHIDLLIVGSSLPFRLLRRIVTMAVVESFVDSVWLKWILLALCGQRVDHDRWWT